MGTATLRLSRHFSSGLPQKGGWMSVISMLFRMTIGCSLGRNAGIITMAKVTNQA